MENLIQVYVQFKKRSLLYSIFNLSCAILDIVVNMSKPVQFEEYNCGFPFAEMLLPWFFAGTLWPGLVAILLHLQEPIWGEGPLTGLFSIPAKNTYSLEITANLKWLAANCNCNLNAGSRIPGHFSTVPVLSE